VLTFCADTTWKKYDDMHRFLADQIDLTARSITLSNDEARHLRDVLRLKPGDEVTAFDGAGREFLCRADVVGKQDAVLQMLEEIRPSSPESPLHLTLAPTVLNGEKYDLVIQKAVELGVSRLIPMQTIRGDVKAADAARRLTRWRRIAMEATKQCGRARLMEVMEPMTFSDIVEKSATPILMFSERDGSGFDSLSPVEELTALIGPKGGWDDKELEFARSRGANVVTLGGRIMRAETASIALVALLQHRFGDFN
jgi:16S rRNA (uracil1498-N3)-methyltransferase